MSRIKIDTLTPPELRELRSAMKRDLLLLEKRLEVETEREVAHQHLSKFLQDDSYTGALFDEHFKPLLDMPQAGWTLEEVEPAIGNPEFLAFRISGSLGFFKITIQFDGSDD